MTYPSRTAQQARWCGPNPDGTFAYTLADPSTDESTDSFTYEASAGTGTSEATVTLSFEEAPVVALSEDSVVCDVEEACTVDVLDNDTPTGSLVLDDVQPVDDAHGEVDFDADGTITYTPDEDNPRGDIEFIYTVSLVAGDGTFPQDDTGALTATVRHTTDLVLSVDPDDPADDDEVMLTATAQSETSDDAEATGTVEFFDGDESLGTAEFGSPAVLAVTDLEVGEHDLTAVYNGDDSFTPATSEPITLTVSPATTTGNPDASNPDTRNPKQTAAVNGRSTNPPGGKTGGAATGALAFTGLALSSLLAAAATIGTSGVLLTAAARRRTP